MQIDTTKPNAGRIYDYLLDGQHNYPVDRVTAEWLKQVIPTIAQWAQLNRHFLGHAAQQLAAGNFSCMLDLASGLPTEGYLHELVPATTRILYNDIDPATVAYAQEIIGDHPNVRYVQGDLRKIDALLEQAAAWFGDERRIGIGMVSVAYFIDDAALRHVLQRLYDWAAPGSQLALSFAVIPEMTPQVAQLLAIYKQMGTTAYFRRHDELDALIGPWQPIGGGMRRLVEYQGAGGEIEMPTGQEEMVGGLFEKP